MMRSRIFVSITCCLLVLFPAISAAQEGYYRLGNEKLEFRLAVASEEADGKIDWEELTDLENKRFFVSKEVEINSIDVDGVLVEKMYAANDWHILIYFKKESWHKIRDITNRNKKKRLGIVRGGRLLMAPVILEPLDTQADIVGNIDASMAKWFVTGFTLTEEPVEKKANREREHEKFLEELADNMKNSPEDINIQTRLAYAYLSHKPKECNKAAPLFEKIFEKDPSRTDVLYNLTECYILLEKYETAIKTLERVIATHPDDELTARFQLTDVYKRWGRPDKAINELEEIVKFLKYSSKQDKEEWVEAVQNEIAKIRKDTNKP